MKRYIKSEKSMIITVVILALVTISVGTLAVTAAFSDGQFSQLFFAENPYAESELTESLSEEYEQYYYTDVDVTEQYEQHYYEHIDVIVQKEQYHDDYNVEDQPQFRGYSTISYGYIGIEALYDSNSVRFYEEFAFEDIIRVTNVILKRTLISPMPEKTNHQIFVREGATFEITNRFIDFGWYGLFYSYGYTELEHVFGLSGVDSIFPFSRFDVQGTPEFAYLMQSGESAHLFSDLDIFGESGVGNIQLRPRQVFEAQFSRSNWSCNYLTVIEIIVVDDMTAAIILGLE